MKQSFKRLINPPQNYHNLRLYSASNEDFFPLGLCIHGLNMFMKTLLVTQDLNSIPKIALKSIRLCIDN